MNTWFNLMFQDASSPTLEWLSTFHDLSLLIDLMIMVSILFLFINLMLNKLICEKFNNQILEIIWTILPMGILLILGFPSLKILYLLDSFYKPLLTIKCIGVQWYWIYEFSDFFNLNFESYMNKNILLNSFRLLDVDNRLILPINLQIRLLISSNDVIHSFTVPSMGIKLDGVPGRLNQLNLMINRIGIYFGQCSEICGANHSFMPIVMETTNLMNFFKWINNNLND
uniref:Cytochrome c oxidase subunit 2 n=1 Tax=Paramblynotus sp. ZJUH 20220012 TaxID=2943458 RepID=A0A9E8K2X8_9HYME|nr:cytochrome c oxidase subunit 2 [Paramblynotus sp. ZJUH 20220012]